MSRTRTVPEHERMAIAAEIERLLTLTDDRGRRLWTLEKIGQASGGLTHEAIRKARHPSGVGPAVRDAVLSISGMTMEALLDRHGVEPGQPAWMPGRPDFSSGSHTAFGRTPHGTPALGSASVGADRVEAARGAIEALVEEGVERELARRAVADALFDTEMGTELSLYRHARAALERARTVETSGTRRATSVAATRERTPRRR